MMCSANEIMTLATKAARGAGAHAGQAAVFGPAALSHLAAGCAPTDLSHALQDLPKGPILDVPVLIARQIERASEDVATFALTDDTGHSLTLSYLYAQPFAVKAKTQGNTIHAQMFLNQPHKQPPMPRVEIPDDLFELMQQFAAKTLVPESAASRLSGAGAGLTDND